MAEQVSGADGPQRRLFGLFPVHSPVARRSLLALLRHEAVSFTAEPNKQDVIQSGGVPPVPEPGSRHCQRTRRWELVGRSDPARPRRLSSASICASARLESRCA